MPANILDYLTVFCGSRRNMIFYIIYSLFFINIAILFERFFNIKVVLNYAGLLYFSVIQH